MYVAAKLYKELDEGATMSKLKTICQNILHSKENTEK